MISPGDYPVLVAGGAGYIGSHVVIALVEAGFPVTVIDNLSNGSRWTVNPKAHFQLGDIGDDKETRSLIQQRNIRAIIHCAGSMRVNESVSAPIKYYKNNTAESCALIDSALENGIKYFIFSSSAAVYGTPKIRLIDETTHPQPVNPYGWSKLMTEIMLRDAAAVHDFNYCALRYFNVAGADPFGRAGQCGQISTHLVKIIAEVATAKRDHLAIYGDDYETADGTAVRDYVHVSDLADAHVAALFRLIHHGEENLTLNCGYGHGYSVREVLDTANHVTGFRLNYLIEPRRPGDPPILVADNSQILRTLDWRPKFDALDLIILHAVAWERKLSASTMKALSV